MKRLAVFPLLLVAITAQAGICDKGHEIATIQATTPTTDFELHADGTATHHPTGLMWMRCTVGQSWDGKAMACAGSATTHPWQDALKQAVDINSSGFAGYTDWRVPDLAELATIVEAHCWEPAINTVVFPATPAHSFWTAVPYDDGLGIARGIHFGYGRMHTGFKHYAYSVRLVRAGHEHD